MKYKRKSYNNKKNYWLKITLIGVIIVCMQIISFFAISSFNNFLIINEYEKSTVFNMDNLSNNLYNNLEVLHDNIEDSYIHNKSGFAYKASITLSNNQYFTFSLYKDDNKFDSYRINQNDYNNLINNKFNFYSLNELILNANDEKFIVVSKSHINNSHILLFYNSEVVLKNNYTYGFDEIAVIDKNKKSVFETNDLSLIISNNILSIDFDGAINTIFNKKNNNEVLVVNKSKIDGYYIVGYINSENVTLFSSKSNWINLIINFVSIILSAMFVLLAIIIFNKDQDYLINFGYETKEKYIIKVDNYGNVVKANAEFKNLFRVENIFDIRNLDEKFTRLANNDNLVLKLNDINNEEKIINFLTVKNAKGYKMVGVNGSNVIEYFKEEIETPYIDFVTNVFNTAKLKKDYIFDKKNRQVIGYISLSNINSFGIMFGRNFYTSVLKNYATLIKKYLGDLCRIYRYNQEPVFIIYSYDKENVNSLLRDINFIMEKLNNAIKIEDNLIKVNCIAGLVIVDEMLESYNMIEIINIAGATAKRVLNNKENDANYYIYHESQKKHYEKYFDRHYDIKQMIENDELMLNYQPQFSLKDRKIVGVEALLRLKVNFADKNIWDCITYAEKSGQMIHLGEFVFDTGIKFAKQMEEKHIDVSLNVSPLQLMQVGFAEEILNLLDKYEASTISLEITESTFMSNIETVLEKLKLLSSKGVDIHLDDFGIEYSSLMYLKRLPISAIKIDKEFIKDIETNNYSRVIVENIITMCKKLDLQCIAEGVETPAQVDYLDKCGCDIIQGFIIGKAISENDIKDLIYRINDLKEDVIAKYSASEE